MRNTTTRVFEQGVVSDTKFAGENVASMDVVVELPQEGITAFFEGE